MEEIWKEVVGYDGYMVSNIGNVKSLNYRRTGKERMMKIRLGKRGYLRVGLLNKETGKQDTLTIHRLVAMAFIPNPDNLPQVNHIDENKLNNNVENLEWMTQAQNINYGNHNYNSAVARMKSRNIFVYCYNNNKVYPSCSSCAKELGISSGGVYASVTAGAKSYKYYKFREATKEEKEDLINIIEEKKVYEY